MLIPATFASNASIRLTLQIQHLRDTRHMVAPAMFQAGRLRNDSGMRQKGFYVLMLVAAALAVVAGVACALPQFYRSGALSLAPNSDGLMMTAVVIPTTGVNQLSSRLSFPMKPSMPSALASMAVIASASAPAPSPCWGASRRTIRLSIRRCWPG